MQTQVHTMRYHQHFFGAILALLWLGQAESRLHIGVPEGTRGLSKRVNNQKLLIRQIHAYWRCYQTVQIRPTQREEVKDSNAFCPASFDGWGCWDATPPGHTTEIPCPDLLLQETNSTSKATKVCKSNGTWELNASTGEEKVDYSKCNINASVGDQDLLFQIIGELTLLEKSPYSEQEAEAEAFEKCLQSVLSLPRIVSKEGQKYCPRTFDGWGCWNDTPAGETAYASCPSFVIGFIPERSAHKECNSDGSWYRHPATNRTWSNYTTCVDREDLSFRQKIVNLNIAGYSTSVVALLISLGIFVYFRSIQCTRITIHKNLFISFIINNLMWIVWYTQISTKLDVLVSNEVPCQLLHVLLHYFLASNYFWMFCEGLYLHTVLIVAFVAEGKLLKWFYLIGWGLPLVIIIIYASVRSSSPFPNDTGFYVNHNIDAGFEQFMRFIPPICWMEESTYSWIISGPVCISMLLNFVFLVNIVRVLVTKLRAVNSPDAHQTRKAVRATLILIPLLGLHYFVTPFRPVPRSPGEAVYETVSAIVSSFQGLSVALLFCFFNGEVISLIRKRWNQTKVMRGRSMSFAPATTASDTHRSTSKDIPSTNQLLAVV